MDAVLDPLVLDLVEWVAIQPRPYSDVIERWRTSCPRLTVWEDALDRGLVKRATVDGRGLVVIVTPSGTEFLRRNNRIRARSGASSFGDRGAGY